MLFVVCRFRAAVCSDRDDTVFLNAQKSNFFRENISRVRQFAAPPDLRYHVYPFALQVASYQPAAVNVGKLRRERRIAIQGTVNADKNMLFQRFEMFIGFDQQIGKILIHFKSRNGVLKTVRFASFRERNNIVRNNYFFRFSDYRNPGKPVEVGSFREFRIHSVVNNRLAAFLFHIR